ncbi:MAG: type I phosphomannose isomerase catalytic subunit [Ruthenibacterium lactatiformans]
MARLAMELVEKAGLSRADCAGIGVGSPGICNGDTGEVVYSNNLYWDDVPLCPTLTRLTGLPCRLSNDANCAALGEVVAGAAKGCKTAVLLTLGTGVGGGVVIDGKIYEGQASAGAELGHCTLISGGVECLHLRAQGLHRKLCLRHGSHPPGFRGCGRASRKPAEQRTHHRKIRIRRHASGRRCRKGRRGAVRGISRRGHCGHGVEYLSACEMLLLGGGGISGEEAKPLTDPMNEYVKAPCFGSDKSFVTRVDTATLGNKAGIIGAAALCLSAPAAMPLKLAPAFKDYLWGGERLKSEYGKHTRLSPLAESWELSCHKDGASTIVNGPDAGRTLAEYAARHPACVGTRHTDGVFPVLIKLIDAARPLSVQVHPDDAYAQRVEGEPGKTEMWYVVDAQPGAQLYYGFQRELTREEAARRRRRRHAHRDLARWTPVPRKSGRRIFH